MKKSLFSLMLGGVAIGMAEFMPMGLLPNIAATLSVDVPSAGHLISAYALGVVIGAPLLAAFAMHFSVRQAFLGLLVSVGVFNLLFALAPTFELLFAARLFAGLPHGAFFGLGAVAASRLAEPGRETQAVSIMFAGLTVANVMGVPLGTWIGHQLGWRFSFGLVAGLGLLAAWFVSRWMPAIAIGGEPRLADNLGILRQPRLWLIILISAIGTGGLYAWISYIAPLAVNVAGIPASQLSLVMIVAGLGMTLGNVLGGRIADRFSPLPTTAALLLCMSGALVVLTQTAHVTWVSWISTFVIGAIAFAVISPMQMLMIDFASGPKVFASCFIQSTSNIGNALGAYLGGVTIAAGWGYTGPEWAGAGLAAIGLCLSLPLLLMRGGKGAKARTGNPEAELR